MRAAFALAVVCLAPLPARAQALLPCRVDYPPLVARLKAAGGDPAQAIRVKGARDLARLEAGKRYKFVVTAAGTLVVAPLPEAAPRNEYVHPILAEGKPVRTAGGITVERSGAAVSRVIVDEDSKAYCPGFQTLTEAARALERAGVEKEKIEARDRQPMCAVR